MNLNLIPEPPTSPAPQWADAFAARLIDLEPGLSSEAAMRCAELAHDATWLLDPAEAAYWWLAAIQAATRRTTLPLEPRAKP
jgi:hypothetical protein